MSFSPEHQVSPRISHHPRSILLTTTLPVNLPADINDILDLIHLVSNWMFGLFLTGTVLSFVLIFVMPISIYSRWLTLIVAILAFLNALFVTVASVIATVM